MSRLPDRQGRSCAATLQPDRLRTKRLSGLAEALAGIRCQSAVIDGELVFPTSEGHPDFRRLQAAMASDRNHELAVFAFDLCIMTGIDLKPAPLIERRLKLTEACRHDRRLACCGAAADRARHRQSIGREAPRAVLQETAFDRAAAVEGATEEDRRKAHGRDGAARGAGRCPPARGCGRRCVCWHSAPPTAPPVKQASKVARGKRSDAAVSVPPG